MLPDKFLRVLEHEGVVAIVTQEATGLPHLVNTWNSYIQITADEQLVIPAGGMCTTEKNLSQNNTVLLTMGSRDVEGKRGPGAGFLITGTGVFLYAGTEFDLIKSKFPWARAALKVAITDITQTL